MFQDKQEDAETDVNSRSVRRLVLTVQGLVQGVGFRPYVYRLAKELSLNGTVRNSSQGVLIDLEGPNETIQQFLTRFSEELPTNAAIRHQDISYHDPAGYREFRVMPSDDSGRKTAFVLPDIATCPDCLREILDPENRRYRYPFTNCTNCGPRFSIIESLPYDREHTTMHGFVMCERCREEYENPADRRFHAQPNACPECGPQMALWDNTGDVLAERDEALTAACEAVLAGQILALKGLGGFQLIVDARNEEAIRALRARKGREEKPFALMYPSLDTVRRDCAVSEVESSILQSPQSPIVLLRRSEEEEVCALVAPDNPYLGVMLPYTPLHHLMMLQLGCPVVATSGNLSEEPICIDEHEALKRLTGIADVYLVHDRPIARQVDDSVVRQMAGRGMVMRNARGYAPTPIETANGHSPCLAVGAHLKNTVAIATDSQVIVSQHIGDLETKAAYEAMQRVVGSMSSIYEFEARATVCDEHPDYLSTRYAERLGLPTTAVQHHYAHVLSCMAEHGLDGPVLGVSWDGTGYGPDGSVWGGEFLRVDSDGYRRVAHLRTFCLPGGEAAVREPRRCAAGMLYEIIGNDVEAVKDLPVAKAFCEEERHVLMDAMTRKINAPLTSSAGRLFDGVASILGLCQRIRYEGQAAMMVEHAAQGVTTNDDYPYAINSGKTGLVLDWGPMMLGIIDDTARGVTAPTMAAKFHNTLVEMIVATAIRVGEKTVVLTGGCFQNRYLTERTIDRLDSEGFKPVWHCRIPPNDGGIALGQAMAVRNTQ